MPHSADGSDTPPSASPVDGTAQGRFRLMRYFTISTLLVFVAVGIALFALQGNEEAYFDQVQIEQQAFFAQAQSELARQNEAAARASLIALHEASHVTLTGVVANLLWASDLAPFVARAQALPSTPCRSLPPDDRASGGARRACFAELGGRIRALPGFSAIDAKASAAMHSTKVFKIKVWDLRGVTVYSSEHAQVGDDGSANAGWRAAAGGRPASELTHRDRFSSFEGVVENRDLISSYVPVRDAQGGVVAVFELYSDVTPFLAEIKAASARFAAIATANEAEVAATSARRRQAVRDASDRFLWIVGGLLVLLYGASLFIVRIGQRIIDRQTLAQEQAARREELWHREKMAALAAMADNVAHEVGNPLAAIAGLAQQLPESPGADEAREAARGILQQTDRIAHMMRRMADFASSRSGDAEWVDLNSMIKAVCDFQSFDRRLRGVAIEFRPADQLPACELVPDHLNEVMMNLLQACAPNAGKAGPSRITVRTDIAGDEVVVRIECPTEGAPPAQPEASGGADAHIEVARRRADAMGARLTHRDGALELAVAARASRPVRAR